MISCLKRVLRIDRSRRFRCKGGFMDGTKYIQINADGTSRIVPDHLPGFPSHYTLEKCLRYVEEGSWIELRAWQ